ncbi:MAG: enoyl-CoA hydratase [Desulfosporosinus sp. BRH_c37]|nr:MAG: enoyl-CoA hydratase [Desulfosporosinus sp. BRH_c37]
MQAGDVISWERTFTNEDVRVFSELTGDKGTHHVNENEQGQLMVHGLLTASLPTKIGGDINFIARDLSFEFHRPVMTGDTIKCDVVLIELEELEEKFNLSTSCTCTNQHGKVVLTADAKGIVFK